MTEKILDHLIKEIQRAGFLQPILINQNGIIIDGEHRYKAAQKAGLTEVPVITINIPEHEAKILTINMNQIKGELDPRSFATLLDSMKKDYTQELIQDLLNLTEQEIQNYNLLLELPENLEDITPPQLSEKKITCPQCGHEFIL